MTHMTFLSKINSFSARMMTSLQKVDQATAIFILLALLFGIFFACFVPIGYDNDEGVHVLKAGSISSGDFFSERVATNNTIASEPVTIYGSATPSALANLEHAASGARGVTDCPVDYVCPQPDKATLQRIQDEASKTLNTHDHVVVDLMGANLYHPIAYLPAATAIRIGSLFALPVGLSVVLARIATLLLFIAISGLAIYLLRQSNAKWIIFCVALLPGSLVAASSIGVDSMLNGLSFLIFALIMCSFEKKNFALFLRVLLIVTGLLLPLLKLPYAILSLTTMVLPIYRKGWHGWITRFMSIIIMLLPALYWTSVTADANRTQSLYVHAGSLPPDSHNQLIFIFSHPIDYLLSLVKSPLVTDWVAGVGALTHQVNVQLPSPLLFCGFVLIVIAGIMTLQSISFDSQRERIFRVVMLGVPIVTVIGIATALYLAFNPVGYEIIKGVQGRYFIPIITFSALGAALLLPIKIKLRVNPTVLYTCLNFLVLTATCFWYYVVVY